LKPAAHLTCVDATRAEVDAIIRDYWHLGVRHIVALRGDPARSVAGRFKSTPSGYANAADLVAGIRAIAPFDIAVAAYPEKHPRSATTLADLDMLQAKIDAGASRATTQFFFDNSHFFRFLDRIRARGISAPVVPGIMPIHNFRKITAFSTRAGVSVPSWLSRRFEGLENDPETHRLAAAATCAEQVLGLVQQGITEFHFYTSNRADLVYAICPMLGLRPVAVEQSRVCAS
jgi:methylenetetrahydrofolate reductase (NADPH)